MVTKKNQGVVMRGRQIRVSEEAYHLLLAEAERDGRQVSQVASRLVLAALCPAGAPQAQEHGPLAAFGAEFVRLWETELAPRGFQRVTERQLLGAHRERLQKLHDYFGGNQTNLAEWINRIAQSAYCCGRTADRKSPAELKWLLERYDSIWERPAQNAVPVVQLQRPRTITDLALEQARRNRAALGQGGDV